MKRGICSLAAALAVFAAVPVMADSLLLDRGLPTANLNNAAGGNRSNVAWADAPYAGLNWAIGDTFNLNMSGTYNVSDIRVWMIGTGSDPLSAMWSDLTLFVGGGTPSSVAPVTAASTVSKVTYVGGSSYQGYSGGLIDIYQVDFAVNLALLGNADYSFFVGGTPTEQNIALYPSYGGVSPFLHSSNAALSGSPQQGADNLVWEIGYNSTLDVLKMDSFSTLGNGWDKPSDVNVQIIGAPVPLPAAVWPGMALLAGIAIVNKVRSRSSRTA
jgi:hypothetical protein